MNGNFQSLFGPRLKSERKRLGLSQQQAADLAGVTREHWGRCERGQAVLGGEALGALASAGVNAQFVLAGDSSTQGAQSLSPEEQTLLTYYREASKDVQRAALGALLGATASAGQVMKRVGDGAVQIGSIGGDFQTSAPRKRPAEKPKEK